MSSSKIAINKQNFFIIACQDSKPQQVIRVENAEETPTPIDSTIITSTEKEVVKNYELPGWPVSPKETKDKLYPFDEASKDAGFVKFRQRFYNAVNEKDITLLANKYLSILLPFLPIFPHLDHVNHQL